MKKWIEQFSRALVLVLAAVCLITCATVTVYAGWKQDNNGWWYEHADGSYTKNNWEQIDGVWYYFNRDGYMVTSTWIDDCYLGSDGKMYVNKWCGEYYCGSNGKYLKDAFVPPGNDASAVKTAYVGSDGKRVYSAWVKNYSYYIKSNGLIATSWYEIGGKHYCFADDGLKRTGWEKTSGTYTYYLDPSTSPSGQMVANAWKTIDGKEYHFDANGRLQKNMTIDGYYVGNDGAKYTGWLNGNTYYKNGKVLTGWQQIGGKWYYLNSSGVRLTGNQTISGKYYYFNSDGTQYLGPGWAGNRYYSSTGGSGGSAYISKTTGDGYYVGTDGYKYTGWLNGNTYYKDGKVLTGWQQIGGKWYYLNSSGVRLTGNQTISGKYYYFNSDGTQYLGPGWAGNRYYSSTGGSGGSAYISKTTGDGYYVGTDGYKYTGWLNGNTYYKDGKVLTGWQTIDGSTYYLNTSGVRQTGIQTNIGGEIYKFGSDGKQYTSGGWSDGYYFYAGTQYNGRAYKSAWTPDETYVGSDGKVYTGYAAQNSVDYYVVSGKKANGEYYDGTGTFYFKGGLKYTGWEGNSYYRDGVKQTGWQKIGDYWYYLGTDGVMWSNGWKEISGKYYYLNADGVLLQGDEKGWLQIGSDWYMLKTTGATTPAEGLYSRISGWITIDSAEYYLDPENGDIMAANAWVPSSNDAIDRTAYAGADGARVYDDWVEDYNYYIDDTGIMHIGWKEYDDKWYHFRHDGQKETGWSEQDGSWYYLDPESSPITGAMVTGLKEIDGNKYYFYEEGASFPEGSMATNTFVLDNTYFATDQGILIAPDEFHYTLNPYFDYVPGGLYGIPSDPAEQILVKEAYRENVDKDIPADYAQLSIGAHPAVSVDPENLETVTRAETGWDATGQWVWDYADGQVVDASVENRSDINGNMYALYHSIATLNGSAVDLKITVMDYSVVAGKGEMPVIAFNRQNGIPGVMGLNLSWVQLKYELLDAETGELLPSTTKGNTTYYDIDAYQSVCFNDATNQGIYSREVCELYTGTVTGHGVLDGVCVFLNRENEFDDTNELYEGGVTELFEGNTLVRTFSFKSGATSENYVYTPEYYMGTGGGVIFNDGHPVANGALYISNTVSPDNGEAFKFKITLTNAKELDAVFGGVKFEDGKATVSLKHGESVIISGIPAGLEYEVTETEQDGYTCQQSGAIGLIVKDSTAEAVFQNIKTFKLTIGNTVVGNETALNQQFIYTVSVVPDGGDPENLEIHTVTLMNGETDTIPLPYNCDYTVALTDPAQGYLTTVISGSASVDNMDGDREVRFQHVQLINITLKKQVKGNLADMTLAFNFDVVFTEGETPVEAIGIEKSDDVEAAWDAGKYNVWLMNDETITFTVPYRTNYVITEVESTENDGYDIEINATDKETIKNNPVYTSAAEADSEVVYTNIKFFPVPTGVSLTVVPFVAMVLFGVGLLPVMGRKSRRDR